MRTATDKKASKSKARKSVKGKTKASANGTSKTALVGKLLKREKGCTTAEVLKVTGWPAVSMPQMAKALGLKLKKEKDGRVTRYHGVAA